MKRTDNHHTYEKIRNQKYSQPQAYSPVMTESIFSKI